VPGLQRGDLLPEGDKKVSFDEFWRAYPRRVAKAEARKAWDQTESIRPPIGDVIAAIQRSATQWTDVRFVPHPATWLRGERWDDEVTFIDAPKSDFMRRLQGANNGDQPEVDRQNIYQIHGNLRHGQG
jgi:hypothetical protein